MDLTKEKKIAFKLALKALKKMRRNYAPGKYFYEKYGAETQKNHYEEYQKYSEAIKYLEEQLKEE